MKIRCFATFRIRKLSIHSVLKLCRIHVVVYFVSVLFAWCKKYMIWQILFSKFSDVLPTFTSFCLGINILTCLRSETLAELAMQAEFKGYPFLFVCFWLKLFSFKAIKKFLSFSKKSIDISKSQHVFFIFLCRILGFVDSFNWSILFLNFICFSITSSSLRSSLWKYLPKDLVLNFWKSYVLSLFLLPVL